MIMIAIGKMSVSDSVSMRVKKYAQKYIQFVYYRKNITGKIVRTYFQPSFGSLKSFLSLFLNTLYEMNTIVCTKNIVVYT